MTVQKNIAKGGLVNSREHIEHGSFSRSVRTYKTVKLPIFNFQVKPVNGAKPAELNAEIFCFQQCHQDFAPFIPLRRFCINLVIEIFSLNRLNFSLLLTIISNISTTA